MGLGISTFSDESQLPNSVFFLSQLPNPVFLLLVDGFTGELTRFSGMGLSKADQLELLGRETTAVCALLACEDCDLLEPLPTAGAAASGATPATGRPAACTLSPADATAAAEASISKSGASRNQ